MHTDLALVSCLKTLNLFPSDFIPHLSSLLLQNPSFSPPWSQKIVWLPPSPRKWKPALRFPAATFRNALSSGLELEVWVQIYPALSKVSSTHSPSLISQLMHSGCQHPSALYPPLSQSAHSPAVRVCHLKKKYCLSA